VIKFTFGETLEEKAEAHKNYKIYVRQSFEKIRIADPTGKIEYHKRLVANLWGISVSTVQKTIEEETE